MKILVGQETFCVGSRYDGPTPPCVSMSSNRKNCVLGDAFTQVTEKGGEMNLVPRERETSHPCPLLLLAAYLVDPCLR